MNIFQEPTKSIPKSDDQIVRVDMETQEIGGRKSSLPTKATSDKLAVRHVPNGGSRT